MARLFAMNYWEGKRVPKRVLFPIDGADEIFLNWGLSLMNRVIF